MAAAGGHWVKGSFQPAGGASVRDSSAAGLPSKAEIEGAVARIKEESGVESLYAFLVGGDYNPHLTLDQIVASVEPSGRGQGRGSRAMRSLTALADQYSLPIHLLADARTAGGKGSKAADKRLRDWYKQFGFRENKGRNYDPRYRGGMIREPS